MRKSLAVILLCVPFVFGGCRSAHQIETAAIIENVSVDKRGDRLYYTFYPLTDSETPDAVSVPASSFEEAQKLARRQYIPHLSLAKLELLLIHRDVSREILRRDIAYISTQASFSPVAYVALCDENTLQNMREATRTQNAVEQQILLCKSCHPEVNIDYLSVFNRLAKKGEAPFSVPYITAEDEMKVSVVQISG